MIEGFDLISINYKKAIIRLIKENGYDKAKINLIDTKLNYMKSSHLIPYPSVLLHDNRIFKEASIKELYMIIFNGVGTPPLTYEIFREDYINGTFCKEGNNLVKYLINANYHKMYGIT